MRRRKIRRELAALGHAPHYASPELRAKVRLLAFNKLAPERIAEYLGIDVVVLKYWYHKELDFTDMEVLAQAAANVMELATQRKDLGVAMRANELMLRTRSAAWREPKAPEPGTQAETVELEQVDRLTLAEVERELAKLERAAQRRPAQARAKPPDDAGEPD